MKEENVVLIIAYGNPLRQDDGVGWQTAQHLKELLRDDPVEIIFRQQLTQDLVFSVSNSSRVIFIDSEFGNPPGTITHRNLRPAGFLSSNSTHHMTPIELLAWARILCGPVPRADLVTITGAAFDLNESLSPQVEAALPALLDKIKALVHTSLKNGS
jgi:hydrogenase maturation protease